MKDGKSVAGTQTDTAPATALQPQSIEIVQRSACHAVALPFTRNDSPQVVLSMPLSGSESEEAESSDYEPGACRKRELGSTLACPPPSAPRDRKHDHPVLKPVRGRCVQRSCPRAHASPPSRRPGCRRRQGPQRRATSG